MAHQGPLPDPMPLRDALRGLRHAVRRGGETLLDAMPVAALPGPAAGLAGTVLRDVGVLAKAVAQGVAQGVNEVASGFARLALGASDKPHGTLHDLTAGHRPEDAFAQAIYAALRAVLRRLNAASVYISETAARSAFLSLAPERQGPERQGPGQKGPEQKGPEQKGPERQASDARTAAALSLALVEHKVLRGTSAEEAARVPDAALDYVALFAVMLWLQSDRGAGDETGDGTGNETGDETGLDAATDLAVALASDAKAAFQTRDAPRLAALYAEFARHV